MPNFSRRAVPARKAASSTKKIMKILNMQIARAQGLTRKVGQSWEKEDIQLVTYVFCPCARKA